MSNESLSAPILAALNDVVTKPSSSTGAWTTIGPWIVGFVIAALVIVWVAVLAIEWSRRERPRSLVRQSSLFDQLCITHDLDTTVQQQLVQVANQHSHGDLVLPFIDPRILENAARTKPELSAIGKKLFGHVWQTPVAN